MALAAKHTDRARRIGDFERVRRHFLWATRGFDAFAAEKEHSDATGLALRRSQMLELLAFEEWVNQREGREARGTSATTTLVEQRLFGAIAHLVALHVYPGGLPPRRDGETSAQLVIRAFQVCEYPSVPTAVGVLL